MSEKRCSNLRCRRSGISLSLNNFYKKNNRYDSRCKECINDLKRKKRIEVKKKVHNKVKVVFKNPDKYEFVKRLSVLFEGEKLK